MSQVALIVGKPVDNRWLVREKDRRRIRDIAAVVLVLAPVAAVLVGFAWANVEVIRRGYQLQTVTTIRDELLERNRELRSRLATRTALDQVEPLARHRMGFVAPSPDQLIHVRETDPGSADR